MEHKYRNNLNSRVFVEHVLPRLYKSVHLTVYIILILRQILSADIGKYNAPKK